MEVKVSNMKSVKTGRSIPNQFIITTDEGYYFQSYNSIIVYNPSNYAEKVRLDKNYWDYSVTTGKYRNQFLGESKKETERKIADGTYILTNLN